MTAILDAAAHILGERGWSGFTTNAVADRAGVSIGSLYQYFPDKHVLIRTVRQRHLDEVLAVLEAAADGERPRASRIAAIVDGMIAIHARFPAAHRAMLDAVPLDPDGVDEDRTFALEYRRGYEAMFAANAPCSSSTPDRAAAVHVLAATVAGIVHEGARQGMLASPSFRRAFSMMIEGFLSVPASRGIA